MTYTLGELTYRAAREIEDVREGVATGGSTTTIVDSNNRTEHDDYWNGGTAWDGIWAQSWVWSSYCANSSPLSRPSVYA